jgi:hypothetical protein
MHHSSLLGSEENSVVNAAPGLKRTSNDAVTTGDGVTPFKKSFQATPLSLRALKVQLHAKIALSSCFLEKMQKYFVPRKQILHKFCHSVNQPNVCRL